MFLHSLFFFFFANRKKKIKSRTSLDCTVKKRMWQRERKSNKYGAEKGRHLQTQAPDEREGKKNHFERCIAHLCTDLSQIDHVLFSMGCVGAGTGEGVLQ